MLCIRCSGSGKGTQCAKIVDEFKYVHLSAGDLLRAERNRPGSELGQMIEEYIAAGRIIPVAVTCSLLEKAMIEQMKVRDKRSEFLLQLPRFLFQEEEFLKVLQL